MTKIEKLEAQIVDYKKELEQLEAEIKFLKLYEEKKKSYEEYSRVEKDETYYSVAILGKGRPHIMERQDKHKDKPDFATDDAYSFKNNNYFKSRERAEEVKSKIELLLRLERFYDTFCPEYKPNWNDSSELKYFIEFDCDINVYVWSVWSYIDAYCRTDVYFPSQDIVIKVCDILNAELARNRENETMS